MGSYILIPFSCPFSYNLYYICHYKYKYNLFLVLCKRKAYLMFRSKNKYKLATIDQVAKPK